jgi:hypothetical protein
MPRVNPTKRPADTDARTFDTEQASDVILPATGGIEKARADAAASLNAQEIEPVLGKGMSELDAKAKLLAFYEEKLDVILLDTNDPNPEPHVFLSVNGRGPMPGGNPWVPRNVPVTMARKYVEQLCRAKPVRMRTVPGVDASGAKTMNVQRSSSLRYPFTVVRDPNPRGRAWLQELMRKR